MNTGIIKHAQNATDAYSSAQNNETALLAYHEGIMDQLVGGGSSSSQGDPAEIAKIQAGYQAYKGSISQEDLELLQRYCLGENKQGRSLFEIVDAGEQIKFKNLEPIPNASEELTYKEITQDANDAYIFFDYNGHEYKLTTELTGDYLTKKVELNNVEFSVEGATVIGNDQAGWTVRFTDTKHKYTVSPDGTVTQVEPDTDLDLLRMYFLGEDGKGNKGSTLYRHDFYDEPASIADASTAIKFLGYTNNNTSLLHYIKYNDIVYKVTTDQSYSALNVEKTYQHSGVEGTKVQYSADGTNNKTEWIVLYDNGSTVDIMSMEGMGVLSLGFIDNEAQGENNLEKTINSYNNAISRINNYCKSLIKNSTAQKVRSIGSKPDYSTADTTETYSTERLQTWLNGEYNNVGKIGDTNFEQDYARILYFDVDSVDGWFASRVIVDDSEIDFAVREMRDRFLGLGECRWIVSSSQARYRSITEYYTDGGSGETLGSSPVYPVIRVNKTDVGL